MKQKSKRLSVASTLIDPESLRKHFKIGDGQIDDEYFCDTIVSNLSDMDKLKYIYFNYTLLDINKLKNMEFLIQKVEYIYSELEPIYKMCHRDQIPNDISKLLFKNPTTIHMICKRFQQKMKHKIEKKEVNVGRNMLVDRDKLKEYLIMKSKTAFYTPTQLSIHASNYFNCKISASYIRKFSKTIDEVEFKRAVKTEKKRAQLDPQKVRLHMSNAKRLLKNVRPELLFNVDECGYDEWCDTKNVNVCCPSGVSPILPIQRVSSKTTLIAGICANGKRVPPLFIVSRKTLDNHIETQMCMDDVVVCHQKKAFCTQRIFLIWVISCLVPMVNKNRMYLRNHQQKCVLVMDQFKGHKCRAVTRILDMYNITPLWLPPHSSHLTQPLDLSVFGPQKKRQEGINMHFIEKQIKEDSLILKELASPSSVALKDIGLTLQIHQLLFIWDSYQVATTDRKVINAFNIAGFVRRKERGVLKMCFDVSCALRIKEYLGITTPPNYPKISGTTSVEVNIIEDKYKIAFDILNQTQEDETEDYSTDKSYHEIMSEEGNEISEDDETDVMDF